MKINIVWITIFFLVSNCSKVSLVNNVNYKKFIGLWQEVEGNAISTYEFKENGEIVFRRGIDRNFSIQVKDCTIEPSLTLNNGWLCYDFTKRKGGGKYFYISANGDSLWDGGNLVDDQSVILQTKQYYKKIN